MVFLLPGPKLVSYTRSMLLPTILLLAQLFTPTSAYAQGESIENLAKSKYWTRLMHYHPASFFRGTRSQLDGQGFFFSPIGYKNPEAEMRATVEAFSQDIRIGKLKQHPQCAFPERYRFLKDALALQIQDVACPKLDEFVSKFNPKSATLVFSSAYPNNPGSMFGHTFLRINAASQQKLDLLDYGISFAAIVGPDENPFAFMALGLSGGYQGQFSMLPYYAKVGEYINSESRDIWEYDLNVSAEQTRRMILHAWELETNSYFNYYFFDENCAYELLALLEVARPDWDLLDFPIYVIPAETIKKLTRIPGAVTNVKFRPSLRKKMLAQVDALSREDSQVFLNVTQGDRALAEVSQPAVLDAAMAYFFYEKQKAGGKLPPESLARMREVQVKRAELGRTVALNGTLNGTLTDAPESSSLIFSEDSRPDKGHYPFRLGTSAGLIGDRLFQDLSFKFAFHDLMNDDTGYIRFSQIDFPGITLRYLPQKGTQHAQFRVEKFQALAVSSLFPFTFVEKRASWAFDVSWLTPKDLNCRFCRVAHFDGGAGATFNLFSDHAIFYALGMVQAESGGGAFSKGYRFGPKIQLATIANPWQAWKFRVGWNWISDIAQADRQSAYHELQLDSSWALNQSWDARASLLRVLRTQSNGVDISESKLTLNHYF